MTEVDSRHRRDVRVSRLGILGGTFDPPHIGHLILADQCRQALRLDRVLILPAGIPPHKDPHSISPFHHRVSMARLAFPNTDVYSVDALEGEREGPSYTVETLRALSAAGGDGQLLWLLLGSDSLADLETWREPETIVRFCRLGVYGRPLYNTDELKRDWAPHVDPIQGPQVDVSSTQIRDMARARRSLSFLIPEPVQRYIRAHGLYPGESSPGSS